MYINNNDQDSSYDYKTGNDVIMTLMLGFILSIIVVSLCLLVKEQMDYVGQDKGHAEQHVTID